MCSRTRNKEVRYSCEMWPFFKKKKKISFPLRESCYISRFPRRTSSCWTDEPPFPPSPRPYKCGQKTLLSGEEWSRSSDTGSSSKGSYERNVLSLRTDRHFRCDVTPYVHGKLFAPKKQLCCTRARWRAVNWHQRHSWTSTTGSKVQ